jgi:hypothetical protein
VAVKGTTSVWDVTSSSQKFTHVPGRRVSGRGTLKRPYCIGFTSILRGHRSQDSVVGIATSYGLDAREVVVRVPVGSRIFSSPNRPDRL